MTDVTISVRINENTHNQMKNHDEINWSAVLRNTIADKLEKVTSIDQERAKRSSEAIARIRKLRVFDKGKTSVEIIREWREKRK